MHMNYMAYAMHTYEDGHTRRYEQGIHNATIKHATTWMWHT